MPTNDALIQAIREAIAAAPNSAPLHKHLGDLLFAAQDYAGAGASYRRALDLAPDDHEIKLALARTYVEQNKPDVALVVVEQMLKEGSPPAEVHLLAARLYIAANNLAAAARAYRNAVDLDPSLVDPELENRLKAPQVEGPDDGADRDDRQAELPVADQDDDASDLVERPKISFQNVGGMDKLKEEIRLKIIYPLTHPDIYQAYGKQIGGGILMYGPPGCGKTYLARATAGEVKARFISIGLHDVLDMYIGESERKLHGIFELARHNTPCVLFIDEVDALGASRSDMRYSAGRKIINQFLAELDGVDADNEGVLILAATNAPWHVDPALRRPGRFDRVIFVPPPDAPAREAILKLMLAGKPAEPIDWGRLARQTDEFSGADLKGLVDRAVEVKLREAMQSGRPRPLTTHDLQAALKGVHATTQEWFATARNYAIYSNQGGLYDDILDYLKISK
ncbi:MAG: AAA family ATPase [Anaerolineae bacterium]|nr:AAA family ATPase [Anaerolineae bacterium]